jgi:class 3 adenylate cyclase
MLALANRPRAWLQNGVSAVAGVKSRWRAPEATRRTTPLLTGTLTLLFTDIEGSTRLLEQLGDDYATVLDEHCTIVRQAVAEHDGQEINIAGDGFFVVFTRAADALRAVVEAQRWHASTTWPNELPVRVRMGLHTGGPRIGNDGYVGLDVHRAARICEIANGGNVIASQATLEAMTGQVIEGISTRELGEYRLKNLSCPLRLHQVVADGLVTSLWPLRTPADISTASSGRRTVDAST